MLLVACLVVLAGEAIAVTVMWRRGVRSKWSETRFTFRAMALVFTFGAVVLLCGLLVREPRDWSHVLIATALAGLLLVAAMFNATVREDSERGAMSALGSLGRAVHRVRANRNGRHGS